MNGTIIRIARFIKRIFIVGMFWKVNLRVVALTCLIMGVTVPLLSAQQYQKKQSKELLTLYNLSGMQSSANTEDLKQIITLDLKDANLEEALVTIADKAGLKLMYSEALLPKEATITLSKQFITLNDAIWEVLDGTGLRFALSQNHQLVLLKKQNNNLETVQETITGEVTDAQTGETLPGVNILVKGTSTGASTDASGQYELTVESLQDTLVVSFVGYKTQNVPINGRTQINIALQAQAITGEEMVVIGYGEETSKKKLTGSVARVKGSDLSQEPVSSVAKSLTGRVSGVQVLTSSGSPNASSQIRIRGGNSIRGDNRPLIVVDGVVEGKDFNLQNINADDIKSLNVLKDATAVGIYGTQGSNGVIVIETKNGTELKAGAIQVSASGYTGVQTVQNKLDILNGRETAQLANERNKFLKRPELFPDLSKVSNTDWLGLVTRKAPIYNGHIAVSGVSTNQNVNYHISGNYYNQEGIIKSSGTKKYQFRSNIDIKLSDIFKTGVRFKFARNYQDYNKTGLFTLLQRAGPTRDVYNKEGQFTARTSLGGNVFPNPIANYKLIDNHTYNNFLLARFYLQVKPVENFTLETSFAPTLNEGRTEAYNPSMLPAKRVSNKGGDGRVVRSSSRDLQNRTTIHYSADFNTKNHIDILGGFTWQIHEDKSSGEHAYGFSNDIVKYHNLGVGSDPARNTVSSSYSSTQLVSWLARARYSYRNRYLFTLLGRVDGSSRFVSSNNQYGFFPSGAFAWRVSQEPFMKKIKLISDLKIKASYGASGSQSIGPYRTLPTLVGTTVNFHDQPYSAISLGRAANPDLKWETTRQLNLGLNVGFLEGRFSFNTEYYQKKTKDLLLEKQIPAQSGFSSKLVNVGAIRNRGLELDIQSINIEKDDFQWSTNLSLSGNRNKVLNLAGNTHIVSFAERGAEEWLIPGYIAPVFVGVNYLGTWKSQKQIDESSQVGSGQVVGGPHFQDVNKDGAITVEDYHPIGNAQPDFYGGIENTFQYKNVTLNIFFQGTYGNQIYNQWDYFGFFRFYNTDSFNASVKNRWTPNNRKSNVPRAGSGLANSAHPVNTEQVQDGSYIRLKHINLSYNLPTEQLGLNNFRKLTLFFSGENLLLISPFKLFDPASGSHEAGNSGITNGEYPYARTLTFGLKASF